MDRDRIAADLDALDVALSAGGPVDLRTSGFWRIVGRAKRDPEVRKQFADRIAVIDRAAFEGRVLVHVGLATGTWLMALATATALVVIGLAYGVSDPWNGLLLLAGTAALMVTTHGLGHLAVGAFSGIRFTHWFIASVLRPQPGVKVDYESYLAVPAGARARMHAAGAVATKSMPFLMLGAAWGMGAPAWAWVALVALGLVTIATDALWSTKSSDWKRYLRERRLADQGF